MSGYFNETGPIARQAKDAGLNVKMLGGDGWDSSEILQSGGEAIYGSFFCNHYNNKENRPEVQEFLSKWKDKYGGVPATTMGASSPTTRPSSSARVLRTPRRWILRASGMRSPIPSTFPASRDRSP